MVGAADRRRNALLKCGEDNDGGLDGVVISMIMLGGEAAY
jgi:hypothetical protein